MNNKSTRSAHFALIALLLLGLASCSSGGGSADDATDVTANFTGTWILQSITPEGGPTVTDAFGRVDLLGDGSSLSLLFSDDDQTLGWYIQTDRSQTTFRSDGSYSDTSYITNETESGSWTEISGVLTITVPGAGSVTYQRHTTGDQTDAVYAYDGSYSLESLIAEDAYTLPTQLALTGPLVIDTGDYAMELQGTGSPVTITGALVLYTHGEPQGIAIISNPSAPTLSEAFNLGFWTWDAASQSLTLDIFSESDQTRETHVWTVTPG